MSSYEQAKVVSFGCDPEIFLQDPDGNIKSAIGLFGGSKEAPAPLPALGNGFAVQEDNILMEFNIPPARTPDEFVAFVQKTMDLLSKRAMIQGLSFAKGSAYSVNPQELQHPKALVFGCDPDFNAYTGEKNPAPKSDDPCLRSAGGHIAFGINVLADGLTKKANLVHAQRYCTQIADLILGIPSLLTDDGEKRKELYGKAGAYRPKPWGIEYRTLSNFWLFNPKLIQTLLQDFAYYMHNFDRYSLEVGQIGTGTGKTVWDQTQLAIDTNNKDYAKWFIKRYRQNYWPFTYKQLYEYVQ